jgi:VWFA-related protein
MISSPAIFPFPQHAFKTARVLKMVPRLFIRLALLSLASPLLATFTAAQQPQRRSDDVLRVNTELVQTDFMVFDKQGNFVDGLKSDQFVLKVEGKPREITFFDRIAAGSRNEEAQLAAARGNPANTDAKKPAVPLDRGRTVMFFLDDLHLSNGSMGQARQMLKRFVEREMRQNDQSAIATATGQLGFLQQLTDNREVMMTAIDRLRTQQQLLLHTAESPPMTEYQALAVEQRDSDVIGFFVDAILKENPGLGAQTAAEMVRQRASQILEESSSITTRSLSSFRAFVENTSVLPSRKLIFFISDGFFLDRNHSDNYNRLQFITSAAARSGTVIYSIDARGLTTGLPDASVVVAADPSGRLSRGGMGELKASQDGLNAMANDTGGRAFFNTNSLSLAITSALKETSVYYLLAWRPDNDEQRNAKFRRLEVSITGRPDLIVRFRRGFGESAEQTAKRTREPEKLPVRKTPLEELRGALQAVYPLAALPVSISLAFLDSPQYGSSLTTSIKIATNSLSTEKQGEVPTATLDVAGLVLNDQGKSVSTFSKRVTVRATIKGGVAQLPDYFFYNHFSLMKPGIYQVRVAALDLKQGTRGSAHQWITIPDLQSKDLTMSSLIVGEKQAQAAVEPANPNTTEPEAPAAIRQVLINVDHRFARTSYLRFLTFIYNATTASVVTPSSQVQAGGSTVNTSATKLPTPDLAVQVQVFRDNEPVITTPLHKINTEGVDARRVPYAADVKLDDLQPGAYVLQVTVIDRQGKSSASQKINFQID